MKMSALEALAVVNGEQGYLVLNTRNPYKIGEVITESAQVLNEWCDYPTKVIAEATEDEFLRQVHRLSDLVGVHNEGSLVNRRLYRVIVPD